ncbi:MAG: zinc-ribbon domain-containing protein [Candidatus Bathyarchaeia archaeon]
MTRRKKKELQEKISATIRPRKIAIVGLIVGLVFIVLGQLLLLPALFIVGYTVFIICTGIYSFLSVLRWQYARALKMEMEEAKPPPISECPRCGTKVGKNVKFCPKCGKKIQAKKL